MVKNDGEDVWYPIGYVSPYKFILVKRGDLRWPEIGKQAETLLCLDGFRMFFCLPKGALEEFFSKRHKAAKRPLQPCDEVVLSAYDGDNNFLGNCHFLCSFALHLNRNMNVDPKHEIPTYFFFEHPRWGDLEFKCAVIHVSADELEGGTSE